MNPNVLISAAGSIIIAVTALVLNSRGFGSIERRLELIGQDLKEFYKHLNRNDIVLVRLIDKTGLDE